jgi:t-SNARE complex subunit (syntaxin)
MQYYSEYYSDSDSDSNSNSEKVKSQLNSWLCKIKSELLEKYTENNKNTNKEFSNYFFELSKLGEKLNTLITHENTEKLKALDFPLDLIQYINDMNLRAMMLDTIKESLTIFPFNKSPSHAEELSKQTNIISPPKQNR